MINDKDIYLTISEAALMLTFFFAYDINAIIDNGPSAAGDDDLIGGEQPTQNPNNTHMFRIWFT